MKFHLFIFVTFILTKAFSYFYRSARSRHRGVLNRRVEIRIFSDVSSDGVQSIDLLSGLNKNQKAAVISEKFSVGLCESGPGSGKTRVLTHRIAYLLSYYKVNPYTIMALTFTNKAGNEMKERLKKLVNENDATTLTVGTFHSMSSKLLRNYNGKQQNQTILSKLTGNNAMNSQFSIYDTDDSIRAIKSIILSYTTIDKNIGIAAASLKPIEILSAISKAKVNKYYYQSNNSTWNNKYSSNKDHSHLHTSQFKKKKEYSVKEIADIFLPSYEDLIHSANALDFDDLLLLGYRLLKEIPEVRQSIRKRFKHILVDEYQDTDVIQYEFVKLLYGSSSSSSSPPSSPPSSSSSSSLVLPSNGDDDDDEPQGEIFKTINKIHQTNLIQQQLRHSNNPLEGRSLFVVGDINQSIYSWRGAVPENMLQLSKDYPHLKKFRLFENYRSTDAIVKVAVTVLGQPDASVAMTSSSSSSLPTPVCVIPAFDDKHQAETAVSIIRSFHADGLKSIAVFYRTNAQSRDIEEALISANIKYKLVGGLRFYDRKEIKDVLCYLKLAANPRDRVAAERAINTPPRGIGPVTVDKFFTIVNNNSKFHIDDDDDDDDDGETILDILNRVVSPSSSSSSSNGSSGSKVHSTAKSKYELSLREKKSLRMFADVMNALVHDSVTLSIEDTIVNLIEALKMKDYVMKTSKSTEQAIDRMGNIEEFIKAAAVANKLFEDRFVEDGTDKMNIQSSSSSSSRRLTQQEIFCSFLNDISLMADVATEEINDDDEVCVVQLMTIHAAKGLEFDGVLLTGCEEGTLPITRSEEDRLINPYFSSPSSSSSSMKGSGYDDTPEIGEERRLAYVAITRARQVLVMLWRQNARVFGGRGVYVKGRIPSRFLTCLQYLPKKICVTM